MPSVVMLMKINSVNLLMEPLLTDYRNLLKSFPSKWIVHTFCEANQCEDVLAKLGARSNPSFVVFLDPPPVVASLLAFHKITLCCNRLVKS